MQECHALQAARQYYSGSDEQIFENKNYIPNMTVYSKVLGAFKELEKEELDDDRK